jgi:hypothetical protein
VFGVIEGFPRVTTSKEVARVKGLGRFANLQAVPLARATSCCSTRRFHALDDFSSSHSHFGHPGTGG